MDFFPEIDISSAEAEAIARGLFAVARADGGIHEREAALIRGFYGDAVGGDARNLAALENSPDIAPDHLALALSAEPTRLLFIKTAILVAWADNQLGDAEKRVIDGYATALGVGGPQLATLEQGVKEFLLGHLVHLQDIDSAREVAKKLSV